ncbi:hypothetical protein KVD52_04055 [Helicobacter pylori]|nr:hypothetical protein KVD52_04055 [Helicobacter pylori]
MQFFDFSLESFIATLMKILALLIAIIGHEIMHGLSAFLLEWFSKMERYGFLVVFIFLFIPPLSEFFIHAPTKFLFSLLLS